MLYMLPSLWCGVLLALWLQAFMDIVADMLPAMASALGAPLFLVGLLVAIGGVVGMAYEQLHLKRLPQNLDAYGVYVGSAALFLGNQLDGTLPGWFLLTVTSLLMAVHMGIGISRLMAAHTQTAASSILTMLAYVMLLTGLTWFTNQVL